MSANVEGSERGTLASPSMPALGSEPALTAEPAGHTFHDRHPHAPDHILLEPQEDRWRWRRKIRQNPRKLFFYRIAVGIAGLFFICLGLVSGPIPGPGGIPLVLLGLAVWASEFEWAHRLMQWFKARLRIFRSWPRRKQTIVVIAVCLGFLAVGYSYLLILGIPSWLPAFVTTPLSHLPGI